MIIVPKEKIPEKWKWFPQARFGAFIHWGPYSVYGRGEQVLFREHLDQRQYEKRACAWCPDNFDAKRWADTVKASGMKYAVMTTRHHDGFCMWDTAHTNYSSAKQVARRDYIREYTDAFREAGLRVGLYYSLADWRVPAYWEGPDGMPEAWCEFQQYVHNQLCELMTNYGRIDQLWLDGAWPHSATAWNSVALLEKIRERQTNILINNRTGLLPEEGDAQSPHLDGGMGVGESKILGDYGTPERRITIDSDRVLWEACHVPNWRLWGYAVGERWKSGDMILDMLVEAASKGGNLLLNIAPKPNGSIPDQFDNLLRPIGKWLEVNGEAVYGSDGGDVCEMVTRGWQTVKNNLLYLVIRFWDGRSTLRLAGLANKVENVTFTTEENRPLSFTKEGDVLAINGLPEKAPTSLFPVIKIECEGQPQPAPWALHKLWTGDPKRMTVWAKARGDSVMV